MPDTRGNYFWHTDKSYHSVPSFLTMLHAVELPPEGGDTQFANMILAYRSLPEETKRRIAGLRGIHSWEASRLASGSRPASEAEIRERPPVEHPLVRIHPDTGEKALYIGTHAAGIAGMPEAEGRALLTELQAHATHFVGWANKGALLWPTVGKIAGAPSLAAVAARPPWMVQQAILPTLRDRRFMRQHVAC